MSEEGETGGNLTEIERSRELARATIVRVKKYEDLNAPDEQEGDESFNRRTRELWDKLAVHGIVGKDKKTGKTTVLNFSDTDGKSALGLLKQAGINTENVTYVYPGVSLEGKINIDTGGVSGIKVEQEGRTVYIDHHQAERGEVTSATQLVYESLVSLGLIEKKDELDNLVRFVTDVDNKTYKLDYENSWRSLYGLNRKISFDKLYQFFREGKDPSMLSEEDIKEFGLEEASHRQKEIVDKTPQEFEDLKRNGFLVESDRYGQISVGIVGESELSGNFDAAKHNGCDTYILFNPGEGSFFISSNREIDDDFGAGLKVRGTMWICPRLIGDEVPAEIPDLGSILTQMVGRYFNPTGKLADYLGESPDVNKVSEMIGEATDKEEQPPLPEDSNLSSKQESDKIEGMTEKQPKGVEPEEKEEKEDTPQQQIEKIRSQEGEASKEAKKAGKDYDETLLGLARLASLPTNWSDIEELKGYLSDINKYARSHAIDASIVERSGCLITAIGLRIEELKEKEQKAGTATEREQAGRKKEDDSLERSKVREAVDLIIKSTGEMTALVNDLEKAAKEINSPVLVQEVSALLNDIEQLRGRADSARVDLWNGDIASIKTEFEEIKTAVEKSKKEARELRGKIEKGKSIFESERKVDDVKKALKEIKDNIDEAKSVIERSKKDLSEVIAMVKEDKVLHRQDAIKKLLSEVELIENLSSLEDLIKEINKLVLGFASISREQIEEIKEKADKISDEMKELEKIVKERTERLNKILERAKELLRDGRERRERETEGIFDVPETEKDKRAYIRRQLQIIEQTAQETNQGVNARRYNGLVRLLPNLEMEMRREVEARMKIHDSAIVINRAEGILKGIGEGASALQARRTPGGIEGGLSGDTIKLALIEGFRDLKVSEAWNLIQDANYSYEEVVKEARKYFEDRIANKNFSSPEKALEEEKAFKSYIDALTLDGIKKEDTEREKGVRDLNYEIDKGNENRRRAVREYLKRKLYLKDEKDEEAEQSMMIAEKLVIGTLESAVFNYSESVDSNQLGICIGFDKWRMRRTGRARGPEKTIRAVKGFSTSWLRYNYLYADPEKLDGRLAEREEPFKTDKIRSIYRKLDALEWGGYYCHTLLGRVDLLRELFLRTDYKQGEITVAFLRDKATKAFNESDPPKEYSGGSKDKNGKLRLRNAWVTGILDCALSTNPDLGWSVGSLGEESSDFLKLYDTMVNVQLSPEEGTFLSQGIWDSLLKLVEFDERIVKLVKFRNKMKNPTGLGGRILKNLFK